MSVDSDKDLHFLVVDDDSETRRMIVEYLGSMGYEKISQARDGTEALAMVQHDQTINFIISDWDMPKMNGLTLLQHMKSHPTRANIPFLIVTSPVSQEAEKVILAAENLVDSYLIKPFRSQVFKQKIDQVLNTVVHGPQKQVVVIDDDRDAREMVVEYMKQMGFRDVAAFEDGRKGIDYLTDNAKKVGVIVCDWEMPEMTGIEVLRACKLHKILVDIPFLMVTSQSSIERMKVLQAAKANVDDYLLKPFNHSQIRKRIESVLERARNRKAVQGLTAEGLEDFEHGRFKPAQSKFEEAIKLDPSYDVALRALGDLFAKTKGVDAGLPYYKKAIESNPVNPKGYVRLANAYEQVGLVDKALALLQNAIQNISFSADIHFQLGRIYNKKTLFMQAEVEFTKVLELQPDHQEARMMLEMVQGKKKE